MNDSRLSKVSQLLMNSRSRHHTVESSELKKISREWVTQKRASRDSNNEVKKMLREMRYFEQLNHQLSKEVVQGKKKLRNSESIRGRHNEDLKKKKELDQLRCDQILKNHQLANRMKEDRQNRISAVQRSIYLKKSSGNSSRMVSRELREKREENSFYDFTRNRDRVESIVEFECNSKEKSIKQREDDILLHIRNHKKDIKLQKESVKLRESQTSDMKRKLRSLTENSTRKLQVIEDLNLSINKFNSPYYSPLVYNKHKLRKANRYSTEKNTIDNSEVSTVFVSQYNYQL